MDAASFPAPVATRQEAVLQELSRPHPLSHRALAAKYDFASSRSVGRIAHGEARVDGRRGRPTLLSGTTEKHLIEEMDEVVKRGGVVTPKLVEDLFMAAYKAEHGSPPPHPLNPHWLQRMARRHHQQISFGPVKGMEERRAEAQTRAGLNNAMQSLKREFTHVFPHGLLTSHVLFGDETSIQTSGDWTAGAPGLHVRSHHPRHAVAASQDITCFPVFSGDGELLLDVFVLPGEPLYNPVAAGSLYRYPNMELMWSPSGKMQGDQDGIGTWHAAMKKLCAVLLGRHGPGNEEKGYRFALFVDGAKVHLDHAAIADLDRVGVAVIKLPPNLTQIIQVPDNGHVFGKYKENLRKVVDDLRSQVRSVPLELYLTEAHKALTGTLSLGATMRAMKECGFAVDAKGVVSINDDSIRVRLDAWESAGHIWSSGVLGPEGGMALRNRYVMQLENFVAKGVAAGELPPDTREWVNPAVVQATARVTSQVPTRARRAPSAIAVALKKGQHRVRVPASACVEGTRRGTVVLNSIAALSTSQFGAAPAAALGSKPVRLQRAETLQQLLAADPDKARALKGALPDVDLEDVRPPLLKYLRGKRDINWAVTRAKHIVAAHARERAKSPRLSAQASGSAS